MELPVGYRFLPTDEELVCHYLYNKVCCRPLPAQAVQEITSRQLFHKHPKCSDITAPSSSSNEKEWYFFILEEEENFQPIRYVGDGTGFWKFSGGGERPIYNIKGQVFAFKSNFTYFSGSPSQPRKTHWRMELFRLPIQFYTCQNFKVEKWVLGRVKSGIELKDCF